VSNLGEGRTLAVVVSTGFRLPTAPLLTQGPPTPHWRCRHLEGCKRVCLDRYVYDIDSGDPSKWIRLRDTGAQVTLTVKEIEHDGIDGAVETEGRRWRFRYDECTA
jgi:hypothetical protein